MKVNELSLRVLLDDEHTPKGYEDWAENQPEHLLKMANAISAIYKATNQLPGTGDSITVDDQNVMVVTNRWWTFESKDSSAELFFHVALLP